MAPKNDGMDVERLVATIEQLLLPQGFKVEPRERVYDENGVQIAELDLHITGKVGSADYNWLIECRDRPSDGPQPGAWIEQLVGRRARFNFDKVTAVSTTGFAQGAVNYAKESGIDLREVNQIALEVARWLQMDAMRTHEFRHLLEYGKVHISDRDGMERVEAARERVVGRPLGERLLRIVNSDEVHSLADAFMRAVDLYPELIADLESNGPAKLVQFRMAYPTDGDHYLVDTPLGPARITQIDFSGTVQIVTTEFPRKSLSEYKQVGREDAVAQVAEFPFEALGQKLSLDLHCLMDSGRTHFSFRPLDQPKQDGPEAEQPTNSQTENPATLSGADGETNKELMEDVLREYASGRMTMFLG